MPQRPEKSQAELFCRGYTCRCETRPPPYNTGSYLNALRIAEGGVYVLVRDQGYLDPTSEADATQKLADCWSYINTRALAAATEQQNRTASASPKGQQPPKRLCMGDASSRVTSRNMFSSCWADCNRWRRRRKLRRWQQGEQPTRESCAWREYALSSIEYGHKRGVSDTKSVFKCDGQKV